MNKKFLWSCLGVCFISQYANASNYSEFQNFNNQVSFGVNYQNGNLNTSQNGAADQYSNTALNLEVEKLFDIGLWANVNVGVTQTYTQTSNPANSSGSLTLGAYPYLQTMNGKLGYNFPLLSNLAITPYALLGKNANLTNFTSVYPALTGQNMNITNNYFYTYGGGVRLEYIPIPKLLSVFLDQSYAFNNDQTKYQVQGVRDSAINASNSQWTTTLGVKVTPWRKLFLGGNLYYTNYTGYDTGSVEAISSLSSLEMGVPTTSFGFQLSAGFTFE